MFALCQCHGVRGYGAKLLEGRARAGHQMVLDGKDSFAANLERALEQKVVDADDGTGKGIFHGQEQSIRGSIGNGAKGGVECGAGDGANLFAQQLNRGGFAEGARLTLKRHSHRFKTQLTHLLRSTLDKLSVRPRLRLIICARPQFWRHPHDDTEPTKNGRLRRVLRKVHRAGSGGRVFADPGDAAAGLAEIAGEPERGASGFPLRAREVVHQGCAGARERQRTHFCVPIAAHCARRPDADGGIRAG